MQTLWEKLLANYQQDLLDLREHFSEVQAFWGLLEKEGSKTFGTKKKELLESLRDGKESSGEETPGFSLIEGALGRFSQKRSRQFLILKERGEQSAKLRAEILALIGGKEFTPEGLVSFFSHEQLRKLTDLSEALREVMEKLGVLDQKIMEFLKMEVADIRLELHRLHGGSLSKKLYQNQSFLEARFIDKMK